MLKMASFLGAFPHFFFSTTPLEDSDTNLISCLSWEKRLPSFLFSLTSCWSWFGQQNRTNIDLTARWAAPARWHSRNARHADVLHLLFFVFHSFIFMPVFPLGRVAGTAALRGLNSNLRSFCSLHIKTGPSKVGYVVTPLGPWTSSGPLSRAYSHQDLPLQFLWDILDILPNERSWDLLIWSISVSTFRALRISQLRTLSRGITPRTLRKNPISAAWSRDSIPSVMNQNSWPCDHRNKDRFKIALPCLKAAGVSTQSDEASAELHLLHQSVHQSPCSAFHHS